MADLIPSIQHSLEDLGRLVRDPESALAESELPGLDTLIADWYDDSVLVSQEEFSRRILKVFARSDHNGVYHSYLNTLPAEQQNQVTKFVRGEVTAKQAGEALAPLAPQNRTLRTEASAPKPAERKFISASVANLPFQNWGRTVMNTPAITYYPENIGEIQTIVRDAVKNNQGVRVSGFRHSWAPLFGRNDITGRSTNGDVLISTLTEQNAGVLPNFTSLPSSLFQPKASELNDISVVDAAYVGGPALSGGKKYVRVGTATTNEQFRRWCNTTGNVTLPLNIIEVEITFGGSNATICHGAGVSHPTLSDLVRCVEYVDVNGEIRIVNMADHSLLNAASGCFGLMGVVTHITFECDPMSTAVMRPQKLDVIDAIPPPPDMKDSDIPMALFKHRTPEQKQKAQADFERRSNEEYYAEWFWFPFSSQVWVNTWSTDAGTRNVVDYPSTAKIFLQVLGTIIMNVGQNILKEIDALKFEPLKQTTLLSWLAMKNLDERKDDEEPIRTRIPDALHFQRGVQNIRVRDLEVEIPLHAKKGTTNVRDYINAQRAWWVAIKACYDNVANCPQRMPLEMRIMSDSQVTMAPQRGNNLGTCSVEILTLESAATLGAGSVWAAYAQSVLDKWVSYTDNNGKRLNVRPHWAKEWDGYRVDGKPWRQKLKEDNYRDEIVEFKGLLAAIGERHGWTLADVKRTFSNDLLDYMYLDDVNTVPTVKSGGEAQEVRAAKAETEIRVQVSAISA
ncbi:hypothetical protein BX600DRAFT_461253 [Xylariales sp. PMI_506]|nr:hypothetical protein BX600DRAFT_461253 [Xylariales sp. PMI_506]